MTDNVYNPSDLKPSNNENSSDWDNTIDEKSQRVKPTDAVTTSASGDLNTTTDLPLPEGLIGHAFGNGSIVAHIGSGGMGDVYKIFNERMNRYHAVKLLKRGSDPKSEKRFEREIMISATFDTTNIVHVYNAGRWKGYLYLEMEYIEGDSLDILLQKRGTFPPITCIAIGIFVARALTYAHHHNYTLDNIKYNGVIHRDLKPSNIMIANDGRLKLMDFGIARPVGGELATLTMGIVGSWVYLPPEQLDGCSIDHRADIYTLGEVLYEVCTGKAPFVFENQREFLNGKTRGKFPPIASVNNTVPDRLIRIIDKCLSVNPNNRFQSADALERELEKLFHSLSEMSPETVMQRFVQGEHVQTKTNSIKRKTKRIPSGFIGGILVLCMLVIGLVVVTGLPRKKQVTSTNRGMLSAPEVLFPENNDTLQGDTLIFSWNAISNADGYIVHLSADDTFSDTISLISRPEDTTVAVSDVNRYGVMFWRIGARRKESPVVWSTTRTFVRPPPLPAAPRLLQPEDKKSECPMEMTFHWEKVKNALSYRFTLAEDELFRVSVFDSSQCMENYIQLGSLTHNTTYFWRVTAANETGMSNWSAIFRFSTKDTTPEDFGLTAAMALKKNQLRKAEKAIEQLSGNDSRKDTLILRLAGKHLDEGNSEKAMRHLKSVPIKDSYKDVLMGRVLIACGQCAEAFKKLSAVSGGKTVFNKDFLKGEAIYFSAKAAQCHYNKEKNRDMVMDAWKAVCRIYRSTPQHPRFKEAAEKSGRIASEN